ncbi:hypothetical protein VE01_10115 [Pseudogymnoascus verrucosus]|uniref:Uncharacterized protein n=1 Tax=Pseudogymnoascus verrucosus TaxID=342668 RepID=A0A1B8G7R4_9PEZI|nr:uncharacterized protein VE01_10115 [Pseudogymnoascus verrucosus]OBT91867.1 hypothetical protein VE01_10115 [Pseudogymnoascus verrucosus]
MSLSEQSQLSNCWKLIKLLEAQQLLEAHCTIGKRLLAQPFIMLRPSPTMISLSKRDVVEHLENVVRKAATAPCGGAEQPADTRFMQPLYNRQSTFMDDARAATSWGQSSFQGITRFNTQDPIGGQSDGVDVSLGSRSSDGSDTDEVSQMGQPISLLLSLDNEDSGAEDVYQLTRLSLRDDNPSEGVDMRQPLASRSSEPRRQETPQENNLGYGGFTERPSSDSSSFVPDDVSTPQEARLPALQRLRVRNPFPRSPLYRSYNHRLSPEGSRSVGLASQLVSPGTPGVLFSQPARRSRDYRLRTSAFSREESNKSRSILEDFDISEPDYHIDLPPSIERSQLHGASFQSPDGEVSHPSFRPTRIFHPSGVAQPEDEISSLHTTNSEVSPHSLHLPPPSSTRSRSGSATGSLPAGNSSSTERSPGIHHGGDAGDRSITPSGLAGLDDIAGGQGLQQSSRSGSATSNVSSVPFRLVSAYRSRSPIGPWHLPSRPSPTIPRVSRDSRIASSASRPGPANTPYRRLQVYDERVPASLQPQTPDQLPEARHFSPYHFSYTAPAGRRHASAQQPRWQPPQRRWRRRSGSPPGLETPGFAGLYGGQENTDDEVMFERAAQRLFLQHGSSGRDVNRSPGSTTPGRGSLFREA